MVERLNFVLKRDVDTGFITLVIFFRCLAWAFGYMECCKYGVLLLCASLGIIVVVWGKVAVVWRMMVCGLKNDGVTWAQVR